MFEKSRALVLLPLCGAMSWASTPVLVGSGKADSDIQTAINSCPVAGCEIVLTDTAYELPREIWIEQKSDFVLRRSDDLRKQGIRPRLHFAAGFDPFGVKGTGAAPDDPGHPAGWMKWPASPTSSSYIASSPYAKTGYTYGGMVVVERSKDVVLEGLWLDGGKPRTFVNPGALSSTTDLVHGNVGANLHTSLRVRLAGSEISGFFIGVQTYGNNPYGANSEDPFTDCYEPPPPLEFVDTVGLHVVERDLFHGNVWAIRALQEKDLGSTARFNLAWDNRNSDWALLTTASPDGGAAHAGGFFLSSTYSVVPWRIHNNTIWGSPLAIGREGYGSERQHLFYGNIFGGFDKVPAGALREAVSSYRQALAGYPDWMERDLFVIGAADSLFSNQPKTMDLIRDAASCAAAGLEANGCWVTWDEPVALSVLQRWLWNGWKPAWAAGYEGMYKGKAYWIADSNSTTRTIPGGGRIGSLERPSGDVDALPLSLTWANQIAWQAQGRYQPDWAAASVTDFVRGKGSPSSGWDSADVGAVQKGTDSVQAMGWRSWEHVGTSDRRCFSLPLRPKTGTVVSGAEILSVEAWSIASIANWQTAANPDPPVALKVASISDTSIPSSDGHVLKVCLDSAVKVPASGDEGYPPVRFLVKAATRQGNAATGLEATDFLWRDSLRLLRQTRPPHVGVRQDAQGMVLRMGTKGWMVPVGAVASVKARLVGVDGRTVWASTLVPVDGSVWVPRPAIRRILFLQIRDESGRYRTFQPAAPGWPRPTIAPRAACG